MEKLATIGPRGLEEKFYSPQGRLGEVKGAVECLHLEPDRGGREEVASLNSYSSLIAYYYCTFFYPLALFLIFCFPDYKSRFCSWKKFGGNSGNFKEAKGKKITLILSPRGKRYYYYKIHYWDRIVTLFYSFPLLSS